MKAEPQGIETGVERDRAFEAFRMIAISAGLSAPSACVPWQVRARRVPSTRLSASDIVGRRLLTE